MALTISASGTKRLHCSAGGVVCDGSYAGEIAAGQTADARITLENPGCQSVQLTHARFYDDVDSSADAALLTSWFSLDPASPGTLRGGESREYTVHFAPTTSGFTKRALELMNNDASDLRPRQTRRGAWDIGPFATATR